MMQQPDPFEIYPHYPLKKRSKYREDFTISFTYGDLFPTMRYKDGKPYRGKVYLKNEILRLVDEYGWPQEWNKDGDYGPERYIEAQVWDDRVIRLFLNNL